MSAPVRIQNVSGKEHCRFCCESPGLAVVAYVHVAGSIEHTGEPATCPGCQEQRGPCPMCERGLKLEFPEGGKRGPWGNAGFWRGVVPLASSVQISCRCEESLLPTVEAKAKAAALVATLESRMAEKDMAEPRRNDDEELAAARQRRLEADRRLAEDLAARSPTTTLVDDEIDFAPDQEPTTLL